MRHPDLSIFTCIAVLAFLPAAAAFAMSQTGPVNVSHPVVTTVDGEMTVRGKGQSVWERVDRGTLLLEGDVVRTAQGSRAQIRFLSGRMELYSDTEIEVPSISEQDRRRDIRELEVKRGCVLLDVNADGEDKTFRFRTGKVSGQTAGSILTVSDRGQGTAVNLYMGEAIVSHGDNYSRKTSSLVPGSSIRVVGSMSNFASFDPEKVIRNYNRNMIPAIDEATGLHIDIQASGRSDADTEDHWESNSSDDHDTSRIIAGSDLPEDEDGTDTGEEGYEEDTENEEPVSDIITEEMPQELPDVR